RGRADTARFAPNARLAPEVGAPLAPNEPNSSGNLTTMKATGLNHVSVHARDLEESTRFYEEFFGMRRVATPDFGYPVQWLEVGELQIHLFVRPTEAPEHHHFSLDVDDYGAAYTEARRRGILLGGPRRLPDGAVQMYIQDPAGNRVEMDWPD